MEYYFNDEVNLAEVKDSMQFDSYTVIAELEYKGYYACIEVRGEVRVQFNPRVKDGEDVGDGECYNRPSEFPQELKDIIAGKTEICRTDGDTTGMEHNWELDDRVYVSENNWFELFFGKSKDNITDSIVVDVEGETEQGVLDLLMGAINDYAVSNTGNSVSR